MSDVQQPVETPIPVAPVTDPVSVAEVATPAPDPVVPEPAQDEPPPVAEPAPASVEADPDVVGSLEPPEMMALNSLRQRAQQLTFDLGNLEIRKARMVAQIDGLENQGQTVLNQVGKRLGLAEGQQWTLLQDGRVKLIKQ
jgi:hypothetical protein